MRDGGDLAVKSTPKKLVDATLYRWATAAIVAGLTVGCASDSGETTEPLPISPVVRGSAPPTSSENSQRQSAEIKSPTDVCPLSVSAGSENSSGKEGAVVVLPETEQFQDAQLLYRVESTGSVIEVREMIFSFGSYSSGDYTFELYLQNGKSCRVPVSIRPSDIESRLKMTLLITTQQ
jgi:hypothetical protein